MRLSLGTYKCWHIGFPYLHLVAILVVFLAAVILHYVPCPFNATIKHIPQSRVENYRMEPWTSPENWMEQLPVEITKTVQLKDLVIPGSHDSATFDLDPDGGKAADFSSYMEIPDSKVKTWFQTQTLDFLGQLDAGIRYFDLRIIKHKDNDAIHFVHGLYSKKPATEYLKDVRRFLDEHKREIVILDFNHIYDMTPNDHNPLCLVMEQIFSGIMLNTRQCQEQGLSPSKMTLSQLWEMNAQVIVLYGNSRACTKTHHIWPRHEIDILWPYTPKQDLVVENLESGYEGLYRKDVLVVWQGILTPHSDVHFLERLETYKDLHAFVSPTTNLIVQWIKSKPNVNVNIVCADFVEEHKFVETVIRVNYK